MLAQDLGDCRDNLRNSQSVFLIVWRKCTWVIGVSSLPIQDITGEYIDTDDEYMYYYSAEFVK